MDAAIDDLLDVTQKLARQQPAFAWLQRVSPEVAQRIGRSLFDQMLVAEATAAFVFDTFPAPAVGNA